MSKVRIFALGGLDEDGKNMFVIENNEDIFVIECGMRYPTADEQLGVEMITPDFQYLIENQKRIKGVFVTHGHDDVMGALTQFLKQVKAPIYMAPLTARMFERKARKEGIDARNDAEALVNQTRESMNQVGDKLDPTLKATVENDLKALEDLVNSTDINNVTPEQTEELKAKRDTLMNSAQQLFSKMYEQAQSQYAGQQGSYTDPYADQKNQNNGQNGGDDVVDGDYKEV